MQGAKQFQLAGPTHTFLSTILRYGRCKPEGGERAERRIPY